MNIWYHVWQNSVSMPTDECERPSTKNELNEFHKNQEIKF